LPLKQVVGSINATPSFTTLGEKFMRLTTTHDAPLCPLCGTAWPDEPYARTREWEYETVDDEFTFFRCADCSVIGMHPQPGDSDLSVIYPSDYYANKPSESPTFLQRQFWRLRARSLHTQVLQYVRLPTSRPLRVLDVGCGYGDILEAVRHSVENAETWGCDLSDEAIEQITMRGHRGIVGDFDAVDLPESYFDIVLSYHVIEHVRDPVRFLHRCGQVLAPGGSITIATPNTDSVDFRMFGKGHWGGYHTPRHWTLFDRQSLEIAGQKAGLGKVRGAPYSLSSFWVVSFHAALSRILGKRIATMVMPPVKLLRGGIHALLILTPIALLERLLLRLAKQGNAQWMTFESR
jgi:SAM-dependent methyltransferase